VVGGAGGGGWRILAVGSWGSDGWVGRSGCGPRRDRRDVEPGRALTLFEKVSVPTWGGGGVRMCCGAREFSGPRVSGDV
jgi:hypothetical protein